jgi:tetratricopeptide (TPR) repeat protein
MTGEHPKTRVAASEAVGTRVAVQGLTQRPQHNGRVGRVRAYDAERGRYAVELGGETVLMRPANVRPACGRAGRRGTAFGAGECVLCLGSEPPPMQSGCACRGEAGLAHAECRIAAALAQAAARGPQVWQACQTCRKPFSGAMFKRLALARLERAPAGAERALSLKDVASVMLDEHRWQEARERSEAALAEMQAAAPTHPSPDFLSARAGAEGLLAAALLELGLGAHACVRLEAAMRRSRAEAGPEAKATLMLARQLASVQVKTGRAREAQATLEQLVEIYERLRGGDEDTRREAEDKLLSVRNDLSIALHTQGKLAEAATMMRAALAEAERVLGPAHPNTVTLLGSLATSLYRAGDYAGAEEALRKAVPRAAATKHPDHELLAQNLASTLRRRGKGAEADATASAASRAHGALAAGERVVLHRLMSHPERNGQRGTVLAHNEATARYSVEVGDRTLSLQRASLRPARCARPGCVDDGDLMCSQCSAAWYCSAACQRAHWKEHKSGCA